jgi:hypothetical protein
MNNSRFRSVWFVRLISLRNLWSVLASLPELPQVLVGAGVRIIGAGGFFPSTCSRCSFLPVCWGGCPKKHLDEDRHAILEQGAYWRRNLPRLIAEGVGLTCDPAITFADADQFRDGEVAGTWKA